MDLRLDCYQRAGKIAAEVRENARRKSHIGSTLFPGWESIEYEIRKRGAEPAFPVNVSLNDIAAHYTAEPDDNIAVNDTDVLKIDIGVHVQGYIADTAVTVCYDSKYDPLVKSAEAALSEARRVAKTNIRGGYVGRGVGATTQRQGLRR